MAQPQLTLFVDIVSPFAYLAFHIIENTAIFKPCKITYVPIFLGGVMKATGNTPPIKIKNKDKWINTERIRWAKYANIPITPESPAGFPPNTIHAQRALAAIETQHPEKLPAAIAALYNAFWVQGKPIQDASVYGPALAEALGGDKAKAILEGLGSKEVKDALQRNTDRAIEEGAFGLPWFVATNGKGETERFWGFDHLGQVIAHLGLERGGELKAML